MEIKFSVWLEDKFFSITNQTEMVAISHQEAGKLIKEFKKKLTEFLQTESSLVNIARELYHSKVQIHHLIKTIQQSSENSKTQLSHLETCLSFIEVEIDLLHLRINHPELNQEQDDDYSSPLFLSDEVSQADVVELLSSLHAHRFFRKKDSTIADFSIVIKMFERSLNTRINNHDAIKSSVLRRKIRLTSFLDTLKTQLIKLSEMRA